ncbi:MAG: hypothetical protein GY790_07620 [Bacteroidetes bacterium]|nr:hypothetical protein [Bacteroidota bacterium]
MNKLLPNTYRIHYFIIAIISLVAGLLLYTLLPGKQEMWMFVNSDTRYMAAIYTDLFVHHTGLHGWHLPASPNFFPDMLVFSLLMALLKGPLLTAMVYGVLQLTTVLILVNILIRTFDPEISVNRLYILSLVILFLPFSSILGESHLLPSQLLFNGYHCGFFINSLLATIFYVKYVRSGKRSLLVLMSALSMVAVVSDKLFIIGFTGPLLVVSLVNYFHASRDKRHLVVTAAIIVSTLAGLGLFKLISASEAITFIPTTWKTFNFQNIGGSFSTLVIHMKSIIIKAPFQRLLVLMTLFFMLGAPPFLLAFLKRFLRNSENQAFHRQYNLLLYMSMFTFMVFWTPVINGSYVGPAIIRYNYAALIIGSLGFIYLLLYFFPVRKSLPLLRKYFAYACSLGILIFLLLTGIKHQVGKGLSDFAGYYPESTRLLDSLKSEHQLKYGVSEYWQALSQTQYSHNGLRLYTVWDDSFRPWYHVTNENWYHDGGKGIHANPVFNYLVVDRFKKTEKLGELFGSAMDTLCNKPDLVVIKVPDFKFDSETREIYLLNQP